MTGPTPLIAGDEVADSPAAPLSLCRSPDGVDTGDSSSDWRLCAVPSPGAANVP